MNKLVCKEEIIDTQIIGQKFKKGIFIAEILDDDKDEDIFNIAIQENNPDDKNINHWTQYLVGTNTTDVYMSDGNVMFRNNIDKSIMQTNESIVKRANDVYILDTQKSNLFLPINFALIEGFDNV